MGLQGLQKLYEVMWGDSLHAAFTKGVDALESKVHLHSSLCGFPAKLLHWPEHHSSCTEEKPSAAPVTGRRLCEGSCRSSPAQRGTGGLILPATLQVVIGQWF